MVCNNAHSDLNTLVTGIPQGSVLVPTLFCLYYNGIIYSFTNCDSTLFADDTEAYYSHCDLSIAQQRVNFDLEHVNSWLENNAMVANVKKTKSMIIASKPKVKMANKLELSLQDERLDEVTHFDYLGVRVVNNTISWDMHVAKLSQRIHPIAYAFKPNVSFSSEICPTSYLQTMAKNHGHD